MQKADVKLARALQLTAFSGIAVGVAIGKIYEIPEIIRWHLTDVSDGMGIMATVVGGGPLYPTSEKKSEFASCALGLTATIAFGFVCEGLQSITVGANDVISAAKKLPETIVSYPHNIGAHPFDWGDMISYVVGSAFCFGAYKALTPFMKKKYLSSEQNTLG